MTAAPITRLKRNLIQLSAAEVAAVQHWYQANIHNQHCVPITEPPIETWRFLAYLCDHMGLLAHGSHLTDLTELVPVAKQRGDLTAFGNATQIFASPDALWAIWFALINRNMPHPGTANSCVRHQNDDGTVYKTYWFSVAHENITSGQTLANGTVYLLRPEPFVHKNGEEWGCKESVTPIASIQVTPQDWPFADAILGFDRERLGDLLEGSTEDFPWFDDESLWKIVPEAYR